MFYLTTHSTHFYFMVIMVLDMVKYHGGNISIRTTTKNNNLKTLMC